MERLDASAFASNGFLALEALIAVEDARAANEGWDSLLRCRGNSCGARAIGDGPHLATLAVPSEEAVATTWGRRAKRLRSTIPSIGLYKAVERGFYDSRFRPKNMRSQHRHRRYRQCYQILQFPLFLIGANESYRFQVTAAKGAVDAHDSVQAFRKGRSLLFSISSC